MAAIRRSPYAFFYLEDYCQTEADNPASHDGSALTGAAGVLALAILTGERHRLGITEFELLRSVPSDRWVDRGERDPDLVQALIEKGLLVSNADKASLRERDELLSANQWNLYAALYHFMTQWSGVRIWEAEPDDSELRARTRAAARAFVARHGPPPGEFAPSRASHPIPLPGAARNGALYDVLTARRTTRRFDVEKPMMLAQLDTVMRYVFGCHGYARNVADVLCIKRTSPSGGGLHPIEVYPIISNVEGVESGIYHYEGRGHSLSLVAAVEPGEGRQLATRFMSGQSYFGAAHVSFVLTARFYRNHWKYRRHQKAYAGILMDAAHLSQTLYLVAADLGLGAFVTIALSSRDIEERLGLDGVSEGVIAMSGCGQRAEGQSLLELQFAAGEPAAEINR
jgi:putative peptide maturation dehydrogenase